MFPITSRYFGVPTATIKTQQGSAVVYLRRRFVPPAERLALLHEYTVKAGDRLDVVTAQFLDDPEQFWRIADANNAMQPDDLTRTPGTVLRITLPDGVPGTPHA